MQFLSKVPGLTNGGTQWARHLQSLAQCTLARPVWFKGLRCLTGPARDRLNPFSGDETMLPLAIVFLVIALIAGALGLAGAAYIASEVAWVLFVVFLILFVVSLVAGRRAPLP
jgi:uncharacterized membrane protein YtjA (UPF0391 family)